MVGPVTELVRELQDAARVAVGTDDVSTLFSTIETVAWETPAATAMSFCVGRAERCCIAGRYLSIDRISP